MTESATSVLAPWVAFFAMTAASAATLTGLMFVVVTLVSSETRTQDASDGIHTFSTPTVTHFGAALLVSAILAMPWSTLAGPIILLALAGIYGVIHIVRAMVRAGRLTMYSPDAEDWTWYTILPLLAYFVLLAGAIALPLRSGPAMFVLGASDLLLIFIGIRNAWDVVTYIVVTMRQPPAAK